MSDCLTIKQACKHIGVCDSTIYNLIAAGRLTKLKVGLKGGRTVITMASIEAYLESCEVDFSGARKMAAFDPKIFDEI